MSCAVVEGAEEVACWMVELIVLYKKSTFISTRDNSGAYDTLTRIIAVSQVNIVSKLLLITWINKQKRCISFFRNTPSLL